MKKIKGIREHIIAWLGKINLCYKISRNKGNANYKIWLLYMNFWFFPYHDAVSFWHSNTRKHKYLFTHDERSSITFTAFVRQKNNSAEKRVRKMPKFKGNFEKKKWMHSEFGWRKKTSWKHSSDVTDAHKCLGAKQFHESRVSPH